MRRKRQVRTKIKEEMRVEKNGRACTYDEIGCGVVLQLGVGGVVVFSPSVTRSSTPTHHISGTNSPFSLHHILIGPYPLLLTVFAYYVQGLGEFPVFELLCFILLNIFTYLNNYLAQIKNTCLCVWRHLQLQICTVILTITCVQQACLK